ncbi:MAG: serine protease [Kiritimatiellaeota bacterium]|nr:serine protease [Kiritimatiellota bacterium]
MKRTWMKLMTAVFGCLAFSAAAQTPEENLLHATFKVFNKDSCATGFLMSDMSPAATPTNVILITANHVLKKATGDSILLVCRIQDGDGTWKRFDHKVIIRNGTNELWAAHPAQDIAVLRCTLPPDAKFFALPRTAIASEASAQAAGLTVGSRLFYFGYPARVEANAAAFPLLREAIVTAYPLFPVARYPTPFMTAPTFAGDSGAPIAMRQSNTSIPLVVGLVVSRTHKNDTFSNDDWTIEFKRDLSLGSFVQAEYIQETLNLLNRAAQP